MAASSSAVIVVVSDTILLVSQSFCGLPSYIYALLVGLFLGITFELTTGNKDSLGSLFWKVLEAVKHTTAMVLKIPVDAREEVFPFSDGATHQL